MAKTAENTGRNEILDGTFSYIIEHGLENVHIRDLCKELGCSQGSIYYWFENKEGLILAAANYGLKTVSDKIFAYVFESISDLESFFGDVLGEIGKYKKELRFVYQMVASPVYGPLLRSKDVDYTQIYDDYSQKLAISFGGDAKQMEPLVYMFAAVVIDYIMWDSYKEAKIQIDFIYNCLCDIMTKKPRAEVTQSVMLVSEE